MRAALTHLGAVVVAGVWRLGYAARFFAYLLAHSGTALRRFRLTMREIYFAGVLSLIIILVSGLFVGMVLGLQGYDLLERFGSEESLGTAVALGLLKELGPVVTALLFAGRAGTALASELGLMRATDQLAAMEVMAVDPLRRVVLPRFLGSVLSMPLLAAIFNAAVVVVTLLLFRPLGITAMALGLLVGSLFAIPVVGLAAGAAVGLHKGKQKAEKLDDAFVKSIGDQLESGGSAIVVLFEEGADTGRAAVDLAQFGGTVHSSDLEPDRLSHFQAVLDQANQSMQQASDAALSAAGGGTVTDVERDSTGYDVEVRLDDGTEVEVDLATDFSVLHTDNDD